jgi:hypothetical protein
LKNLEFIDTTCEETLEYFENDEDLKEMLGFYDRTVTPKKRMGDLCYGQFSLSG